MKVYRIKISSWTSSFRYPNIISGYQPTLLVPPISTVLGIINACSGKYLDYKDFKLGYYFDYQIKGEDLETIYQVELSDKGGPKKQMKSNVIKREFLFNNRLFIYLTDESYIKYFEYPYYQILLGRSNDLATIESIDTLEMEEIKNAEMIKGQIVPFTHYRLPGILQALPKYFTDTIPRNNLGTEAFSVIPYTTDNFTTPITAYRDNIDGKDIDIYFHDLKLGNE